MGIHDIGGVLVFLASNLSDHMTGRTMFADGAAPTSGEATVARRAPHVGMPTGEAGPAGTRTMR